jgi:DNA polymerase elongation subunit (family B)
MLIRGVLIDVWYRPSRDGQPGAYILWIRHDGGVACLEDREFRPSFTIIPERNPALVERAVAQHENVYRVESGPRLPSIYAEEPVQAIRAFLVDERRLEETMREIKQRSPSNVRFAEAKLRPDLQWHYLRNVPPHSTVEAEAEGGVVKGIRRAGPCEPDRMKMLAIHGSSGNGRLLSLAMFDGVSGLTLEGREPDMLCSLQETLDSSDPDVLAIFDADHTQLPMLFRRARASGVSLRLGRIPWRPGVQSPPAGRITHWRAPQARAPGRIILDLWKDARTDADLKRTDLSLESVYGKEFSSAGEGKGDVVKVYELAAERLPMLASWCERCMVPLDSVCREKHGFMNASMVNAHLIGTTVIPDEAEFPEGFKTPLVERVKENGGLVITPEAGLHEDVAIVDFSSLFPRIFVRHNISPETINCRHEECRLHGERVPFLGFHICMRRRGVYPEVFGRVLAERDRVKAMMKGLDPASDEYRRLDVLYRSLKMQLVSPYGYMQFPLNNFRTVDGNRSVPAFGRWYLLRARDMAEEAGFSVIYADTDSLFLHRSHPGQDYGEFCSKVSEAFGMELKLEYVCRWVLFFPERPGGTKGLKKKYFASVGGEPLARGLDVRRQDRSLIARETQDKALRILASARDRKELVGLIPDVLSYVRGQVRRVMDGDVRPDELAIVKKLSRRPDEYKAPAHHCAAAEMLARSGRMVRVGGKVEYVVTGRRHAVPLEMARVSLPSYDVSSYIDGIVRPIYSLLSVFGVEYEDMLPGARQSRLDSYPPEKPAS